MDFFADLPPTHRWAIALWLAAVGGCVGSFLNVVVYRLPAGKSLVRPGSYCPKCGHPIRWYDNVPVIGWFALRGECRDCHEPISLRYPAVEALTAALFFGLAWVELLSGGANLPVREIAVTPKQVFSYGFTTGELVGFYAFHLLLLCTLLAAALIDCDRHRVPLRLFAPALLVGVFALLFWPRLYPGRIDVWYSGPAWGLLKVCLFGVAGLAVGRALGWLVPRPTIDADAAGDPPVESGGQRAHSALGTLWRGRNTAADGILWATVCVGLFFGGAVFVLGAAVFLLTVLNRLARRACPHWPFVSPVIWLTALVPVLLVLCRQLATAIQDMMMC